MPGTCQEHGPWEGTQGRCPPCRTRYRREWYLANHERELERELQRYQEFKRQVYDAYGRKCACCGESEPAFLCLDHVNDDGYEHRKELFGRNIVSGVKFYKDIIRRGFPDTLQVLCQNCNWGKRQPNGCPHQERG
jgi:hypothetical protein